MRVLPAIALVCLAGCSSIGTYTPQTYVVGAGDTLYSIAWRHGVDHRDLARWNGLTDPNRLAVGQRLVLSPQRVAASAPPVARQPSPRPTQSISRPQFSWPTRGSVVARFGDSGALTTGIGITGSRGQDVVAAAPGRVVYAGGGLPDYGQLVIVEHNQSWLTAYGHNQRVLVAQGDTVARGQKIGEMGLGPNRAPRLYFEVRRDGNPLDPLVFLPDSS